MLYTLLFAALGVTAWLVLRRVSGDEDKLPYEDMRDRFSKIEKEWKQKTRLPG